MLGRGKGMGRVYLGVYASVVKTIRENSIGTFPAPLPRSIVVDSSRYGSINREIYWRDTYFCAYRTSRLRVSHSRSPGNALHPRNHLLQS